MPPTSRRRHDTRASRVLHGEIGRQPQQAPRRAVAVRAASRARARSTGSGRAAGEPGPGHSIRAASPQGRTRSHLDSVLRGERCTPLITVFILCSQRCFFGNTASVPCSVLLLSRLSRAAAGRARRQHAGSRCVHRPPKQNKKHLCFYQKQNHQDARTPKSKYMCARLCVQ